MNEAGLGSKYLVSPGKMLQIVICSLSGLSFSRHGSMTPWPLSARPRCFAYHSFICCCFADLKKIPPMPRIRPCWLMAVCLSTGQARLHSFEIADGALHAGQRIVGIDLVLQIDAALVLHFLELLENSHHRHDPFADSTLAVFFG